MAVTPTAVWAFVGVLVSASLSAPMVSQGLPTGDAVVLGRVVDADSGRPIGGVIVTITGGANGPPPGGFIPAGLTTASALTDPQGRFVFRRLPKGTFSLTTAIGGSGFSVGGFIASGLAPQIGPYLNGGYGQRRPNGPMLTLELAEGERVLDAVIRLWRGASIDGVVRDEAGDPLVGVVVAAARVSADGRLLTGPTTRTDDRGAYHLAVRNHRASGRRWNGRGLPRPPERRCRSKTLIDGGPAAQHERLAASHVPGRTEPWGETERRPRVRRLGDALPDRSSPFVVPPAPGTSAPIASVVFDPRNCPVVGFMGCRFAPKHG